MRHEKYSIPHNSQGSKSPIATVLQNRASKTPPPSQNKQFLRLIPHIYINCYKYKTWFPKTFHKTPKKHNKTQG